MLLSILNTNTKLFSNSFKSKNSVNLIFHQGKKANTLFKLQKRFMMDFDPKKDY